MISRYFSWDDVTASETAERLAIDNSLPSELIEVVKKTAIKMDTTRQILNKPIISTSWYRCLKLNRKIGSLDTSDHPKGIAVDFKSPQFGSPVEICKRLIQYSNQLNYKQLILEYSWVHISFELDSTTVAKKEVLTLLRNGSYATGLTDQLGNKLI